MWWEGGGEGCDVIFNITEGGLELIFFCFGGGVLSKFLLDNSGFSAPPPPPPLLIIITQSLLYTPSNSFEVLVDKSLSQL